MTPLMQQYFSIKASYSDVLLFFQVGDFYELFFDDAIRASAQLGIALTQRGTHEGAPIPLCGVPCHVIEHYVGKLLKLGHRIAICDQLTEAQPGKLVSRGVTQVLSPATVVHPSLVDHGHSLYLASVTYENGAYGVAHYEMLTGILQATLVVSEDARMLFAELARFMPREVLADTHIVHDIARQGYGTLSWQAPGDQENAYEQWLANHALEVHALRIHRSPALSQAIYALYTYLCKYQPISLGVCHAITYYDPHDFLIIDAATQRNLEIVTPLYGEDESQTVAGVLDETVTPMGRRTLKKWLLRPLVDCAAIQDRHEKVLYFYEHPDARGRVRVLLKKMGDLERIVGRISLKRATFFDYQALSVMLEYVIALSEHSFGTLALYCDEYKRLFHFMKHAFSQASSEDERIAPGFCTVLDELRAFVQQDAQCLLDFEKREQERTGIASLKVRYHAQHGYAIEVTKQHSNTPPEGYVRLQSLTNRERFTNNELRILVDDIAQAQRKVKYREEEVYASSTARVYEHIFILKYASEMVAFIDVFQSFATTAYEHRYVKPEMVMHGDLEIKEGRHPVVERFQKAPARFVPNDVFLGVDTSRVWLITGPNMGGKSTFLRQTALIVLLAQSGSFVPASYAKIPLCDRIFTRLGSADALAEGKSTFLVEMEETSLLCHQATERSLVILDEVGRGTSTTDGRAIAQAVLEYLYYTVKTKTLFATHYRELAQYVQQLPAACAYHAATVMHNDELVLLHRIVPGIAQGSFGLSVARAARLPEFVLQRAQELIS